MQTLGAFLCRSLVLSVLASNLLLASCVSAPSAHQPTSPLPIAHSSRFEALYANFTFEELTDEATAIFVGKITNISAPQWNQDSGEDWHKEEKDMGAFPIRTLDVEIVQPITETEKLTSTVQIMVIAESISLDENGNIVDHEKMTHGLQTGDQAIFFVRRGEIAWRSGMRYEILFLGDPIQSYFKLQGDGLYHGWQIEGPIEERTFTQEALELETLTERILAARATPPEKP